VCIGEGDIAHMVQTNKKKEKKKKKETFYGIRLNL
jgi:hypothetical protein